MTAKISVNPFRALAAAVRARDAAGVRLLIDEHPELRARLDEPMPDDGFGTTMLLDAARADDRATVDALLDGGASPDARSRWWAGGFSALDFANPELAAHMIDRGATVDVHAAARLDLRDRLDAILGERLDAVHDRGGDGQTPLHVAGSVWVAERLVASGADIDALDVDHESAPAQYLVGHGDGRPGTGKRGEVARWLVEHGCRTDLLMVAALGDVARVRAHLDADPECIRCSVSEEWFPKRHPRAGGTIYTWTLGSNRTAHQVARAFGHREVFRVLAERTPPAFLMTQACDLGDEDLATTIRARHPRVADQATEDDRRRLVLAAHDDNAKAVHMLLAEGWPADARDRDGSTALHWAAWHGNQAIVELLIGLRAPVEAVDANFFLPPLRWALHGSLHSWRRGRGHYGDTIRLLLGAGATRPTSAVDASDPALQALGYGGDR